MRILTHGCADSHNEFIGGRQRGLYRFSIDGRQFAYDPNSMMLCYLGDGESAPESMGSEIEPSFSPQRMIAVRQIVLQACYSCPLRCKYCSVAAEAENARMMTFEFAREAISRMFILKQLPKTNQGIGFFGGEPLMNWDLISQIIPWFEEQCRPRVPSFHITTNGVLLTEEKAQWLSQHQVSWIVSLDGPQPIHDALRVYPNGQGSHADVLRALRLIRQYGMAKRTTLRATYAPGNTNLLVRLQYLNGLLCEGYAAGLSIEPAFLSESTCVDRQMQYSMSIDDLSKMEGEYLRCAQWLVEEVRAGRRPQFMHLTRFLQRLYYSMPQATDCGAGAGYMSLDVEGNIYACHRIPITRIGTIQSGGIDEARRAKWIDNRLYARQNCPQCEIRWVCGGGCREESLREYADITRPVPSSCLFHHIFFRVAAWLASELTREEIARWIPRPNNPLLAKTATSPPPA